MANAAGLPPRPIIPLSRKFAILTAVLSPLCCIAAPPRAVRPAAPPGAERPAAAPTLPPVTPAGVGDTVLPPPQIEWKAIAELPPAAGFKVQPGLAGAFAGAQDKILIIAGGANYTAAQTLSESPKAYWAQIYVLEKTISQDGNHRYHWKAAGAELPQEAAYGASVSTPDGLLCIGGRNVDQCFAECRLLQWSGAGQKVMISDYPKLPVTLADMAAVKLENTVYVLGGRETATGRSTATFLALDLSKRNDPANFAWQKLSPWEGAARISPLAAAGSDGESESIYLCGGRNPGAEEDFLTDLHRYDPRKKTWSLLGNAVDAAGNTATLMAAPTFFVPPHHLVVVGGTDQHLTEMLESNGRRSASSDAAESEDRRKLQAVMLENFPGYSRNVMAFDIVAGDWSLLGAFPDRPPMATTAVNWDGAIILPGGETGPGRRTNKIWQASVKKKARVVE